MTSEPPSPKPSRTPLDTVLDGIGWCCAWITGIALVVLTIIFGWLVFGRYVLNATPTWVEQVALLLVVLITFLGASVGIHQDTHLGVSFFRDVSPPAVRKLFAVLGHLIMAAFGAVMMVQSYKLAVFKWDSMIPLIHVPEGLRAVPITVCGGLVMLFSIGHLVRLARGFEDTAGPFE